MFKKSPVAKASASKNLSVTSLPVDPIAMLWPRLMSVEMGARYLDCTPWHIEELCRSGSIVAFKEGKAWAIDRFELDRYVSRRHAEAAALLKDFSANLGQKRTAA